VMAKSKHDRPLLEAKIERRKERMLEALEKTRGVVEHACKMSGVSRYSYYQYLKNDEEFRQRVEYIEEANLDFAESKLFEHIESGNPIVLMFYLKTKGKKRGYVEAQHIDHTSKGEKIEVSHMTIETTAEDVESDDIV
jgi:hypothetical protein